MDEPSLNLPIHETTEEGAVRPVGEMLIHLTVTRSIGLGMMRRPTLTVWRRRAMLSGEPWAAVPKDPFEFGGFDFRPIWAVPPGT